MPSTARRRIGAACWIAAAPVFLAANVIVGLRWTSPPFSWTTNNISDLGNLTCGIGDTTRPRYVCSPWHDAMNAAFVLTAALLLAGLLLTWRPVRSTGWWLLALGATGLAMAGLFPADHNENLHFLAAVLVFTCGNVGLLLATRTRRSRPLSSRTTHDPLPATPTRDQLPATSTTGDPVPDASTKRDPLTATPTTQLLLTATRAVPARSLRPVALMLGAVGLSAATLFIAGQDLGLGPGTLERLAVFPYPLWATYAGCLLYAAARHPHTADLRVSPPRT